MKCVKRVSVEHIVSVFSKRYIGYNCTVQVAIYYQIWYKYVFLQSPGQVF